MTFQEKIIAFIKERKMSQASFANELGVNYTVMNRNIRENNFTTEFMYALAKRYPEIDLNWLFKEDYVSGVNEPGETYGVAKPETLINEIRALLDMLETNLTQK